MGYVHIGYKPKNELIAEYYLEPATKDVCEKVAGESSIGTWTDISTMKPGIAKKLAPHVIISKLPILLICLKPATCLKFFLQLLGIFLE